MTTSAIVTVNAIDEHGTAVGDGQMRVATSSMGSRLVGRHAPARSGRSHRRQDGSTVRDAPRTVPQRRSSDLDAAYVDLATRHRRSAARNDQPAEIGLSTALLRIKRAASGGAWPATPAPATERTR